MKNVENVDKSRVYIKFRSDKIKTTIMNEKLSQKEY